MLFRVNGRLVTKSPTALPAAVISTWLEPWLDAYRRPILEASGQVDFGFSLPATGRFRCSVYRQRRGLDAVLRVLPAVAPTLEQLRLPAEFERLTTFRNGLVLVTGPTGSGKSSTIAALLQLINRGHRRHILTVEDPVEFIFPSERSIINQREVGRHTRSFSTALRSALREDPNIIMVGELRDPESVALTLDAAETGHLVISTLHTRNTIESIDRLIHMFAPQQQPFVTVKVAAVLRAIVSQRLVVAAAGAGRIPVLEVLLTNDAIRGLICDNESHRIRSVLEMGRADGMWLLEQHFAQLKRQGVVPPDAILGRE